VHALKILGFRRPAPVAPHDLAREALRAEDLVAKHFCVVARLRVDVQHQATVRTQKLAGRRDAIAERLEIAVEAFPAIVERDRQRARDAPGHPVSVSGDLQVLAPRKEWRIQVSEGRTPSTAP
jgi:hypothetical protein